MALQWNDCEVGSTVGTIDKGVMSTSHIMRWSASVENWHRIHYDQPFATGHDKLPGVLINGSWKQHVMVQLAKDVVGPEGWVWKIKFRYLKMDVAGDRIQGHAKVVAKQARDGLGFVTLSLALEDQNGKVSTGGYAVVVTPLPGGAPVPYPFQPRPGDEVISLPSDA